MKPHELHHRLWMLWYLFLTTLIAIPIMCMAAGYQTYKKNECEWCHKHTMRLVVHHIIPQHIAPEFANDHPENYITLCDPLIFRSTGCHYKLGHRGISWSYDNQVMVKLIVEQLKKETMKE